MYMASTACLRVILASFWKQNGLHITSLIVTSNGGLRIKKGLILPLSLRLGVEIYVKQLTGNQWLANILEASNLTLDPYFKAKWGQFILKMPYFSFLGLQNVKQLVRNHGLQIIYKNQIWPLTHCSRWIWVIILKGLYISLDIGSWTWNSILR